MSWLTPSATAARARSTAGARGHGPGPEPEGVRREVLDSPPGWCPPGPGAKKASPTASGRVACKHQQLHHVVDVDHRQRPGPAADRQPDAAADQTEEDQVLPVARAEDPGWSRHRHLEPRCQGDAFGLGLALAVPLPGREGVGLHVGPAGLRGADRGQRAGEDQPPGAGAEHRVTHRPGSLGIHPEECRPLGGAAQPREVKDDVHPGHRPREGGGVGHVALDGLHREAGQCRMVGSRAEEGPDGMSVRDQSAGQGTPEKTVCSGDQRLHVRGGSEDRPRGKARFEACFPL